MSRWQMRKHYQLAARIRDHSYIRYLQGMLHAHGVEFAVTVQSSDEVANHVVRQTSVQNTLNLDSYDETIVSNIVVPSDSTPMNEESHGPGSLQYRHSCGYCVAILPATPL